MGNSLYRINFWLLLLVMAASHLLSGNPYPGAIIYLIADIIWAYYHKGFRKYRKCTDNKYKNLSSYRVFTNMTLYSTIALNMGVMAMFVFVIGVSVGEFEADIYGRTALWLLFVHIVLKASSAMIRKHWARGLALAEFIVGAIVSTSGISFMFRAETLVFKSLWISLWGIGIAMISASIRKFHEDFEAIGSLAGEEYDSQQLEISNTIVGTTASMISSALILILTTAIAYLKLPVSLLLYTPAVFMAPALLFAMKQPLDKRNREKLMLFIESRSSSKEQKESLQNLFVEKYRVRFGVKILCTLVRPFLRLKLKGKENLRPGSYPSVFVCNHGFIYGPLSAVIYLPTYFRPWIHNVMLSREGAAGEMYKSLHFLIRIFGKKLGT